MSLRVARAFYLTGWPSTELSVGADDLFDASRGLEWPGFTGRELSVGVSWPAAK